MNDKVDAAYVWMEPFGSNTSRGESTPSASVAACPAGGRMIRPIRQALWDPTSALLRSGGRSNETVGRPSLAPTLKSMHLADQGSYSALVDALPALCGLRASGPTVTWPSTRDLCRRSPSFPASGTRLTRPRAESVCLVWVGYRGAASQCCSDAAAPRGVQAGSTALDHAER